MAASGSAKVSAVIPTAVGGNPSRFVLHASMVGSPEFFWQGLADDGAEFSLLHLAIQPASAGPCYDAAAMVSPSTADMALPTLRSRGAGASAHG